MPVDFQPDGFNAPPKRPFKGAHYSHGPIEGGVIRGSSRGSSPESGEAVRVHAGRGAPAGVHVYRAGHVAHPAIKSRSHVAGVSGNFAVADLDGNERGAYTKAFQDSYQAQKLNGVDDATAKLSAQNDAERALIALGYDGVEASQYQPGSVLLWGDHAVDNKNITNAAG